MNKSIKEILPSLIPPNHVWKITLLARWDDLIGPMKGKVTIEQIADHVLTLGVNHPAWAQELHLLSPMLKQKINALFDREYITVLKFRFIAPSSAPQSSNQTQHSSLPETRQPVALTIAEHTMLSTIKDHELREALEKFYIRCKALKKE